MTKVYKASIGNDRVYIMNTLHCVVSITSLPYTLSDSRIIKQMRVINPIFGTPSAVPNGLSWEATNGSITFSGTILKSTTLEFDLTPSETSNTSANSTGTIKSPLTSISAQVILSGGNAGASSWTVTETSDNVSLASILTSNSNVIAEAAPASWEYWRNYQIRMSAQTSSSLSFVSDSDVPANTTVTVNILVLN